MTVTYELTCTTRPSSVAAVHDFLDRHLKLYDRRDQWLPDVHVVVDEIASNIEKYAYSADCGMYLVRIHLDNECLEIDFEDVGWEFDPTRVKEESIAGDYNHPVGNLGILLVTSLVDAMRYSRCDGRNVTTIFKRIPKNY